MNAARIILTGMVTVLAFGLAAPATEARMKIGMVVWIGCEDVCRGVQDAVAASGLEAEVVVLDASEDPSRLPDFVERLRAERFDLAVTWGTKATLGIVGTLDDADDPRFLNDIPVVFTVVADPVGSLIIESYKRTGRANLTGTRNRVPESINVKSLRRYLPEFEHLGILYDPNAPNSVLKVEEMQAFTDELDFRLTAVPLALLPDGTPDPESIEPGIAALKEAGVQFIYLGSSAFLEKHTDHFTGAAVAAGLPVLTPYEHMVTGSQALMSVAARDYDVGRLAGEQVRRILGEGRHPGDLPVLAMEEFAYLVNMKVARQLGLYPPVEFLQFVEQVE